MGEILVGAAAFLLLGLSDWALTRGKGALGSVATVLAAVLLCSATIGLWLRGPRLPIPPALRIACGVLTLPFLGLLVLSVLIEPSLARNAAGHPGSLYTKGTYALVRHPGVHWFLLLHTLLAIACASRLLMIAIPFWTAANVALAVTQDRVLFPKLFGDAYRLYWRQVPFLLPTRHSLSACFSTLTLSRRSP